LEFGEPLWAVGTGEKGHVAFMGFKIDKKLFSKV
jgi:hypothetical protein